MNDIAVHRRHLKQTRLEKEEEPRGKQPGDVSHCQGPVPTNPIEWKELVHE